jgi:hypothetical protein
MSSFLTAVRSDKTLPSKYLDADGEVMSAAEELLYKNKKIDELISSLLGISS